MVFKNSNTEKGGITKTSSPSYPRSPGTTHSSSPLIVFMHISRNTFCSFLKKIKDKDILYTTTCVFSERDRQTD